MRSCWLLIGGLLAVPFMQGCNRKSDPEAVMYEGHSLGETPMLWSILENTGASDPLETCHDIVKSGVNPQSDEYKNCQRFVLTGNYVIEVADWKVTGRERQFDFMGWKLASIVTKEPNDLGHMRSYLTKQYGPPVEPDHWRGKDGAKIRLFPTLEGEHTSFVMVSAANESALR